MSLRRELLFAHLGQTGSSGRRRRRGPLARFMVKVSENR